MSAEAVELRDLSATLVASTDRPDVPVGYKRAEAGVIPGGWQLRRVGCMGEVLTGKALGVNAPGIRRPYLRTTNVLDGQIEIEDILTMPMTDAQFEHFRVRRGDILLNEGQSLELVGRCAIYRGEFPEPCAMQNQLLRFRARNGVSAEFASHLFRYCQQTGVFARIALQTTSIAHLGASRFERLVLAWPATEIEQRAIAEALSDVDGLLQALETLIAKKRAIKQAAMDQLLSGKSRLPGFTGEWETVAPDDIAARITGFWGASARSDRAPHPVRVIRAGDISPHGVLTGVAERYFTDAEWGTAGCRLDDVVITVSGNGLGKTWLVDARTQLAASNFVRILRAESARAQGAFLAYALNGREAQRLLARHTATSAYPNLRPTFFTSRWLQLPPFAEQSAIATVLSDMDDEIASLEARLDKTRAIKQGMMQQLLTGRVRLVEPEAAA